MLIPGVNEAIQLHIRVKSCVSNWPPKLDSDCYGHNTRRPCEECDTAFTKVRDNWTQLNTTPTQMPILTPLKVWMGVKDNERLKKGKTERRNCGETAGCCGCASAVRESSRHLWLFYFTAAPCPHINTSLSLFSLTVPLHPQLTPVRAHTTDPGVT